MSKVALLSLLLSFSAPLAFAHNHEPAKCECSKQCKESCQKGKSEKCECKSCECKNTKQCH